MALPNPPAHTDTRSAQPLPLPTLSVSIVVYQLDLAELERNLQTLQVACAHAKLPDVTLTLVDNSDHFASAEPEPAPNPNPHSNADALRALALRTGWHAARVLSGHGNVGYGAGHNLAIHSTEAAAHLVLNPDIELDRNALASGLHTLAMTAVVLVGAVGRDRDGKPGYLSKRMPSVWTFFLRGFAPSWLKRRFHARLAHYEYRDLPTDQPSDVVLVSGAFMLCRTAALQAVGGFDERYFLHFEDLDLSLRLARQGRVVSDPGVTLIHHGGNSASRGLAHLRVFVRSGRRFFNTHGWRWF